MEDTAIEHRLTAIEEGIKSAALLTATELRTLSIEVGGMKESINRQNGRVSELERWRQFLTGIKEGRAEIGKGQLVFLAVAGPLLFAALDFGLRHIH
jgi:hypothetical protein